MITIRLVNASPDVDPTAYPSRKDDYSFSEATDWFAIREKVGARFGNYTVDQRQKPWVWTFTELEGFPLVLDSIHNFLKELETP